MILGRIYVPIIKTGEAEMRALKNLSFDIKQLMLPLFELTRARKNPKDDEGRIQSSIDFLEKHFREHPFILDLTLDERLTNSEIKELFSSNDNYCNWTNFCFEQKQKFAEIIPVVQMIEENDYNMYLEKLSKEVETLSKNFKYIAFRAHNESVAKNITLDINKIMKNSIINNYKDKIIFIFDFKYINNTNRGVEITQKIIKILHKIGITNIVISSTSFPENVSEHMSMSDFVKFKLKELEFFKNCINGIDSNQIIYSDYATVNPVRNDNVIFARGWIPRIDVPSLDEFIYCRRKKRNKEGTYADSYVELAQKIIISDYFNTLIENNYGCWGTQEILNASEGNIGGSSPKFWISVRVNIYLSMIKDILNKVYH